MKQPKVINHLVVHCSASRPKSKTDISTITRDHKARGFSTIGYHYVIYRDGSVHKGRPDTEVGAHVTARNVGSLGICLVGGLNDDSGKPENNFTEAQFDSLRQLLFTLTKQHPQAKVLGHRDLSPDLNKNGKIERSEWVKECPCFDVRTWWG
ncbi:MAG: lysozyme [Methylophilales bacterium 28-44-11]|nr:MAG: lysozyme [Methylophilales bacterium 28-44-11]